MKFLFIHVTRWSDGLSEAALDSVVIRVCDPYVQCSMYNESEPCLYDKERASNLLKVRYTRTRVHGPCPRLVHGPWTRRPK